MSSKKPIKAFKHKHAERTAIPSHEEAGAETASPKVTEGPSAKAYPRNPVVHRGQDPELFWLNKYGTQDTEDITGVDIRSLYRHEHIQPEMLLPSLVRIKESDEVQGDLFGNEDFFTQSFGDTDELTKPGEYYYKHKEWTNRLIQGDSLLVMNSLLEREGMAGQVQCCYIDPPYGIKYGSNWQIHLHNRTITDGKDDHLSGEPEQIKAFRDTWELGIHSYLGYLRDRLLIAKELLHTSGSCFVQISDENVHLVRCLLDEVFGSENFVAQITFTKTSSQTVVLMPGTADYILWYARNKEATKYRPLYREKNFGEAGTDKYNQVELPDGTRRTLTASERANVQTLPKGAKIFRIDNLMSQSEGRQKGEGAACWFPVEVEGKTYKPNERSRWKTNEIGMDRLRQNRRLQGLKNSLGYVRYLDDFPAYALANVWTDIGGIQSRKNPKVFNVQTATEAIKRCLLMTTDPGDLVLDPTCGSGTAAYVAEQWGRRWILTDTSRIALNIAKTRIMAASFPYYELHDREGCDLRQGFIYKKVPHITLGSIANNEPPAEETLYDQPKEDKKRLRIAGPFTVETLQNYDPVSPNALAAARKNDSELGKFEDVVFEHLKSAGVKTGDKKENAVFHRIDRLADSDLHAEGFYDTAEGEAKAYLHIGPKFGTISRQAVNSAIKACRRRGDADWLIILGFSFESDIESQSVTTSQGQFQVSKVRMHDDLLQDGLLKRDKKAASFVTIGEPDIALKQSEGKATVEIRGLDIYDPIKDEVKSRDVHDIAYWMVDHDYDGANFIVRQAFFCGGEKKEFDQWRKGLDTLSKQKAKKKAEKTLKIEIDEEAFDRLYGHESHPFTIHKGQEIAVRVISQFGEETTKVLAV